MQALAARHGAAPGEVAEFAKEAARLLMAASAAASEAAGATAAVAAPALPAAATRSSARRAQQQAAPPAAAAVAAPSVLESPRRLAAVTAWLEARYVERRLSGGFNAGAADIDERGMAGWVPWRAAAIAAPAGQSLAESGWPSGCASLCVKPRKDFGGPS